MKKLTLEEEQKIRDRLAIALNSDMMSDEDEKRLGKFLGAYCCTGVVVEPLMDWYSENEEAITELARMPERKWAVNFVLENREIFLADSEQDDITQKMLTFKRTNHWDETLEDWYLKNESSIEKWERILKELNSIENKLLKKIEENFAPAFVRVYLSNEVFADVKREGGRHFANTGFVESKKEILKYFFEAYKEKLENKLAEDAKKIEEYKNSVSSLNFAAVAV